MKKFNILGTTGKRLIIVDEYVKNLLAIADEILHFKGHWDDILINKSL